MHEAILNFFKFAKSFLYFLRIVCVFLILMLLLFWIQNLTHASWAWLGFITPFLNGLLDISNKIYSVSIDVFGTTFEFKYLSALVILVIASLGFKLICFGTEVIEGLYKSAHFVCKKTEEAIFNKKLKNDITNEEKKLTKYSVVIHTQLKKKFIHRELNINLDEQNQLMNKFISEKLSVKPLIYQGGYIYYFENFDKIDLVLDVLFKILRSNSPIEHSICIQVGNNIKQLNKLIELKHFDKISMAADTAFRYEFNKTQRYKTQQLGVFQNGENSLEVHEFQEIL